MEKHPIGDLMSTTMEKMRQMVDVNTIVGTPITVQENLTLIPVSKVSYGFASGGSDFQGKRAEQANPFGGGAGAGVKIEPVAFIVVKDGNTRLISVGAGEASLADKLVDMAPDLVNRVLEVIEQKKKEKAAEKQAEEE